VLHIIGTSMALFALQIGCAGIILAASLQDIVARTIPNGLALTLAVAGIALSALQGHFFGSLLAAGGVFIAAALIWRRGWMGGGDVKLLGASALGIAPGAILTFIAAVALAGGVLAILYLAARSLMSPSRQQRPTGLLARALRVERWRISRGGPLPYACAVAAGVLFVDLSGVVL
jgi:prepilin peptidase CpaA